MKRKKALSLFDGVVSPELLDFMERQVNLSKYRVRVEGMILILKLGPFFCLYSHNKYMEKYNTKSKGAWKYITTLRLTLNIETFNIQK